MKQSIVFIAALLVAFPVTLPAQDFFGIGPRAGYYKANDADEGKLFFGGAARLMLSPALGIEGSIDYRQEKYEDGLVTVKSWPVMVTGLLYPIPIVYGLVGAGWYNTSFDYDQEKLEFMDRGTLVVEDETSQDFGWHFGAGLHLPVGETMSLTADVRYVYLDYDFSELPGSRELDADFYAITVTLFFHM